jgi:hypothetical protein
VPEAFDDGEAACDTDGVAEGGRDVADWAVVVWVAGAGLVLGVTGDVLEAAVVGGWVRSAGDVAGLNVATESIAPATRQTARMLASSGMSVPCPVRGPASLRTRLRRRWARSSRW